MKMKNTFLILMSLSLTVGASSFAGHHPKPTPTPGPNPSTSPTPIPNTGDQKCYDKSGAELPIDDGKVINWKLSTANQFAARARVNGVITKLFPDHSGHNHFEIKIGPNANDTLEVIYNISFGSLGTVAVGMTVDTCGDYITSNAPSGSYPASPDGAIIHWIHATNNPQTHPAGFLIINNVLYGQGHGNGN